MNTIEEKAAGRLSIIERLSHVLVNTSLFCILYYLYELNRPISVEKLSKELGADDALISGCLQAFLSIRFVVIEQGKYSISEDGKTAVRIAEEGIGKRPYTYLSNATAASCSQVELELDESSSAGAVEYSWNVLIEDIYSTPQRTSDRFTTVEKLAASEESEPIKAAGPEDAHANPTNLQFNLR